MTRPWIGAFQHTGVLTGEKCSDFCSKRCIEEKFNGEIDQHLAQKILRPADTFPVCFMFAAADWKKPAEENDDHEIPVPSSMSANECQILAELMKGPIGNWVKTVRPSISCTFAHTLEVLAAGRDFA